MARLTGLRLSIRHLFIAVPIAALAWAATTPFRDNSFLWHVRAGTIQLDRGRVLTADPFTLEFAGKEWRTQSWLADLLYGALERVSGGLRWVPFYVFAVVALTVGLVLLVTYRRSEHLGVTAGAAIVLCWQAVPFANARPVVFSYLLLAATAAAVHSRRADWSIPALVWLWATLHGSFVLGVGLVVLEAVRTRSRRLFELAVLAAGLATLTAHGIGVWQVLLTFAGNRGALEMIREWQPPDYSNPFMFPYALLILGAVYAAARQRIQRSSLIVLLPFLFFGMLAVRNLYPAFIVALPYVAAGFTPRKAEVRRTESPVVVGAVGSVIVAVAVIGLARPVVLSEAHFPPQTALAALEAGPLFHGIGAGGYLIYAQWPDRQVLVDDRAELFGEAGFERYLEMADAKGWEASFAELNIHQALLDPEWPLQAALERAGWVETYRDEHFVVARAP